MRSLYFAFILTLFASALAAANPINDGIVEGGNAYVGMGIGPGESGYRGTVQLWNPPGSGRALYLERVVVAVSKEPADEAAADIRIHDAPVGYLRSHGYNKNLGGPVSVAEIREALLTGAAGNPGTVIYEVWMFENDDHEYVFDPAIRIPPGMGIYVASANNHRDVPVSFQWREKSIP